MDYDFLLHNISLWPVAFDGGMECFPIDEHLRRARSPNMVNLRCHFTKSSFHLLPSTNWEMPTWATCGCVVQLDHLAVSSIQPADFHEDHVV